MTISQSVHDGARRASRRASDPPRRAVTALALRLATHLDDLGLGLSFDGIDLELTASELEADLAYGRVP